jgi:diaminopimelate epimerase
MTIPFLKMHGAANDFVVIDHRRPFLPGPSEELVRRLCDRRRGVGADGVLLLEPDPDYDFAMRYFNADGRAAEFCGNGARCVARVALESGAGRDGEVRFRSAAGIQRARATPDRRGIELVFGLVARPSEVLRLEAAGRSFEGRLVTAGVPHFVVPVERTDGVPVAEWGAALRRHRRFEPAGANVDFVARLAPGRVALRTYERGVEGETLACGSGAMAAAAWCVAEGDSPPIAIATAGGDVLIVGLEPEARGWQVTLTGPAEIAFRGEWTEGLPATEEGSCSKG